MGRSVARKYAWRVCGEGVRPTKEDRDALRILLSREDLSDWNAEFVESLRNWRGNWTEKQADYLTDLERTVERMQKA